ncbi:MAG TPA: aldo/keto reductase [Telluria sp.]|nr:aldo/keto reductase [Telluria sp.]
MASRLIYGCMGLGGGWNREPLTEADIGRAHAAVEVALDIGITCFDHADIYTLGKAEQTFAALFKRIPSLRERIRLQTKCGIRFADGEGPKRYDLSAAYIVGAVERSLQRLNTERIDVLLLHRPDPLLEPDEINEAWLVLHNAGKVGALGVSNMHAGQIRHLASRLTTPLVANQLEMSLAKRDWLETDTCFNDAQGAAGLVWQDTLHHCQQHGIALQAWGSLAKGWYSGALPAGASAADGETAALVRRLAEQHGAPPESIVLAWLLRHPAGIRPVLGTSHPDRIRACGAAERVKLTRGEWYALYQSARGQELP